MSHSGCEETCELTFQVALCPCWTLYLCTLCTPIRYSLCHPRSPATTRISTKWSFSTQFALWKFQDPPRQPQWYSWMNSERLMDVSRGTIDANSEEFHISSFHELFFPQVFSKILFFLTSCSVNSPLNGKMQQGNNSLWGGATHTAARFRSAIEHVARHAHHFRLHLAHIRKHVWMQRVRPRELLVHLRTKMVLFTNCILDSMEGASRVGTSAARASFLWSYFPAMQESSLFLYIPGRDTERERERERDADLSVKSGERCFSTVHASWTTSVIPVHHGWKCRQNGVKTGGPDN